MVKSNPNFCSKAKLHVASEQFEGVANISKCSSKYFTYVIRAYAGIIIKMKRHAL